MLIVEPFPWCCGISVIVGFGGSVAWDNVDKKRIDNTAEELAKAVTDRGVGVKLVALNGNQRAKFHDIVLGQGFQPIVDDFRNPVHNSRVTLYGRVLTEGAYVPLVPQKLATSVFKKRQAYL